MHQKPVKNAILLFLLGITLALFTAAATASSRTLQGRTLLVTGAADGGPGALRQALLDAQDGDTITFDPSVFPPTAPVTISITSELPQILVSNLTIDASNAGVILDGSNVPGDWAGGLQIVSSGGNRIRGLQISSFSGRAIDISGDAHNNVIGGDRSVGAGPFGQGNMLTHNGNGVVLSTADTSVNTITGNLIGTNAAGTAALGNQTGVWICEGANGNIIGPDNVIAFNSGAGIVVNGPDSTHNTITQNSIHDNGRRGIELADGANLKLAIPGILGFDLSAGTMTGATCATCTVEIFSDADNEGKIFEGQVTADSIGVFTFDKSAAFIGPYLTATTTDVDGNTSPFSAPTTGTVRSLILQQGNDLPISPYWARCSSELLDNHIGTSWGYLDSPSMPGDFSCDPQGVRGFTRIRLSFNEVEDWPSIDWSRPETITMEQDAFVTRLAESGITVTYILNFWDKANHPAGWPEIPSRFTTEEEIQRYLEYVRFIVGHFKDRVRYFELWNEPDAGSAIQHIKPQDYVELVRRVVPIIRDEYPEAKIVVGSIILRNQYGRDYLYHLIQSDVMPLVDVIAWHPMYGITPEYEDEREYYYAYLDIARDIKETAISYGFQGEFRGDEIGWCGLDEEDCGAAAHRYTNGVAAKYYGRGIAIHLGLNLMVHLGGMSDRRLETSALVSNLATVFAGSRAEAFPIQVQTAITNVVSYTFALPNDGYLVALWNDGVAVDYDPGITATLTFSGFADHYATGIDALYGYQQQVMAEAVDGNLVIRDLLVKDYPILLRLSPTRYAFLPAVFKTYPH
ncbi:MAG: right-handed parallel beta-helix repeat-containing protein [Anaerolineae bacterium]|nr:right-handed parallel beta-helix repeat-containing protein [Anaerolineae bacterium]